MINKEEIKKESKTAVFDSCNTNAPNALIQFIQAVAAFSFRVIDLLLFESKLF
jgi:hypothetical protein